MTLQERLELTQLFLAGTLTESVAIMHRQGILSEIERNAEQTERHAAPARIVQFGTTTPEELFSFHRQTAGFSDWAVAPSPDGFTVTNSACTLHAIATVRGTTLPCELCCIIPLSALCHALPEPFRLRTDATLENAPCCRFTLTPQT